MAAASAISAVAVADLVASAVSAEAVEVLSVAAELVEAGNQTLYLIKLFRNASI